MPFFGPGNFGSGFFGGGRSAPVVADNGYITGEAGEFILNEEDEESKLQLEGGGGTTPEGSVFALTKEVPDYSGPAIRVRRSSDNTEQDIGFVGIALDTASLLTFADGGDAVPTIYYDQANQADAEFVYTRKPPLIVQAGVVLRKIDTGEISIAMPYRAIVSIPLSLETID